MSGLGWGLGNWARGLGEGGPRVVNITRARVPPKRKYWGDAIKKYQVHYAGTFLFCVFFMHVPHISHLPQGDGPKNPHNLQSTLPDLIYIQFST